METIQALKEYCKQHGIAVGLDVPLREYCTFKIGGPAAVLAEPENEEQLALLLQFTGANQLPVFLLGRGSNLLFADEGYAGVVVHLGASFSGITRAGNTLACYSGTTLTQLCRYAQECGLSGLEFAYGIPGTVGGAVYMNAGAYGGEIKDVLTRAHHMDRHGNPGSYTGAELGLRYRHSVYAENNLIITQAEFNLTPGDPAEILTKMEEFMGRRREKQPLEYPSAGSTFKRPEGAYASALIDECGLKGASVGGAQVSPKHAGFVINTGDATCSDVLGLIRKVQDAVQEKTGFRLECEVKIVQGP